MRQTENIKNGFRTRLVNFIAYEAQLINNSSNDSITSRPSDVIIELSGCRCASGIKLLASGDIQIMYNKATVSIESLSIDDLLDISSLIEAKFLRKCNIQ